MVDDLILTGSEIVVYMSIHYLVCLLGVGWATSLLLLLIEHCDYIILLYSSTHSLL